MPGVRFHCCVAGWLVTATGLSAGALYREVPALWSGFTGGPQAGAAP